MKVPGMLCEIAGGKRATFADETLCAILRSIVPMVGVPCSLIWRFRSRRAVRSRVGRAIVYARFRIMQNRLPASHAGRVFPVDAKDVAHRCELFAALRLHAGFNHDIAAAVWAHGEPWVFQRRL